MPAMTVAEDRQELGQRLLTLLDQDGTGALAIAVSGLHHADVGRALEAMEETERHRILLALPPDVASRILDDFEPELRDDFMEATSDAALRRILASAAIDDAIYLLDQLDEDRAATLIASMDARLREQLEEQFELDEDSAGHMMQRDVLCLRSFITVGQALDCYRSRERPYYGGIFVVDAESRLAGILGLRDLVNAAPDQKLGTLMNREPVVVRLVDDRERVIELMQRYHVRSIPVVDDEGRLRGQVTWDDAAEAIVDEANEDILAIAGSSEDLEENAGIIKRAVQRLPYLLLTAVGGFVMATLIHGRAGGQGSMLQAHPLLMAFLPLVPALGGNIGIQCSTVTVRSIATGELSPSTVLSRSLREMGIGTLLALTLALVCGLGAVGMILLKGGEQAGLGPIIALSLLLAILVAAAFGVLIPLGCLRLRIDPAIAAGPFITMLNDITGVTIYLLTASLLLS